jgi:hypothetical protein
MNPEARREGLIVEQIGKALVVYDVDREQAHSLNPTAALVWQHCDGAHSVQDLAHLVQNRLDVLPSTELVEMTLSKLEKAHLLSCPVRLDNAVSRREVLNSLGTRATVAVAMLPVIMTMIAPEPALAQSRPSGILPEPRPRRPPRPRPAR